MAEHAPQPATYYKVFAGLIGLTLLTVSVSFLRLGELHTAVGLAIAVTKGLLVALFFMHLLHSTKMTWIAIGSGLFWLGIMMVLTFSDYLTRAWLVF